MPAGVGVAGRHAPPSAVRDLRAGQRLLDVHTDALFGPPPSARRVRIMVTMPSDAATDGRLIRALCEAGMDAMRINCAHDDPDAWRAMIAHAASAATAGRPRIVMDLAGPKLRTGRLADGPSVCKVQPARDPFGRVVRPAAVWLHPHGGSRRPDADAALPVDAGWLSAIEVGDRIRFADARGARRVMCVIECTAAGAWATLRRTAYVVPGTRLTRGRRGDGIARRTQVGAVPARPTGILLTEGDPLWLLRSTAVGHDAVRGADGAIESPAAIGCTLPKALDAVRPGDPVWFDDGRIGAVVERMTPTHVELRIRSAIMTRATLRADKGINLPDTPLGLAALTDADRSALPFVARHADVVELSFVNAPADVAALHEALVAEGREPAIVLKIETRQGFERLPELLLAAMRASSCGVMIARGDLAVECGFERLAEVQEEILWLCEEAHVPVIWATQVLESLAKEARPSRAEVTDAAMADRAECAMLNKGPHILEAVRTLDDILRRMQAHQAKKQSMLRELRLARAFVPTRRR
jgi:pyruvate kinase